MIGDQRKEIHLLYTVDEILKLDQYATTESVYPANEIYEAVSSAKKRQGEGDSTWIYLCAVSAVYNAGRLQGMREERKRNKDALRKYLDKLRKVVYCSGYAEAFDSIRSIMRDIEQRV